MADVTKLLSAWNTATVDRLALSLPLVAATLSSGVGVLAMVHSDYWTGALGVIGSIVGASGVLATGRASQRRDEQLAFWVDAIDRIDRSRN